MRNAYAVMGVGFVVLIVGSILINQTFTKSKDTEGAITSSSTTTMSTSLTLTSSAFADGATIPSKYTCEGTQISPPLSIVGMPEGTKSFALIVEDPDVPKALMPSGVFLHWLLFNIPPSTTEITEGNNAGLAGSNGAGKSAYAAPCPPPQYEPSEHRYIFTLYALDTELPLKEGATKDEVVNAMQGHILSQTELLGRYKKTGTK